jgi:hypothetical protein
MGRKKRVILIGLNPWKVDYSNWPDLIPEILIKMKILIYFCHVVHACDQVQREWSRT